MLNGIVMRLFNLLLTIGLVALTLAACKQNDPSTSQPAEPQLDTVVAIPVKEPAAEPEPVAQPAPRRTVQRANKPAAKGETIYVSSYDQKGPVWGHVTMTGDSGTGVIHDSEENTFSVSCTRHGNELFAIDQNSRQYVFKLGE